MSQMSDQIPEPYGDSSETQDPGYQECQDDIKELQAWAAQVGQKIGVPFTPDSEDQEDSLSNSLASTKPFGAGAGMSNS